MESKANELKALQIMFKALMIGPIVFVIIAVILVSRGLAGAAEPSMTNILLTVAALLSISTVTGGYILFRKRVERTREMTDLAMRLQEYRAASILKWALFEGPCLFVVIGYFLTGQLTFLILTFLLLLNFTNNYPSKDKVVKDLELNSQEEGLLG